MRGHRRPLVVDEVADVDGCGDDRLRRPEVVHLGRVRRVGRVGHLVGAPLQELLDMVAIGGRLVDALRPCELGRAHSDTVYLYMVRMPVAAVVVVHGEYVGVLLAQQFGQARRRLVDAGARERVVVVVGCLAGHAGVAVAEVFDAVDAQDFGLRPLFGHAPLRERLAGRERVRREFAQLAASREHENDAMPLGLCARHRAGGRDRLVVGVRVEGHECVRHSYLPRRGAVLVISRI